MRCSEGFREPYFIVHWSQSVFTQMLLDLWRRAPGVVTLKRADGDARLGKVLQRWQQQVHHSGIGHQYDGRNIAARDQGLSLTCDAQRKSTVQFVIVLLSMVGEPVRCVVVSAFNFSCITTSTYRALWVIQLRGFDQSKRPPTGSVMPSEHHEPSLRAIRNYHPIILHTDLPS